MERVAGAKDGGFDERSVLLRVLEAKDGVVVDIDEVGDEGGVVGEEDLLVRIHDSDDDKGHGDRWWQLMMVATTMVIVVATTIMIVIG